MNLRELFGMHDKKEKDINDIKNDVDNRILEVEVKTDAAIKQMNEFKSVIKKCRAYLLMRAFGAIK